MSTSLSRLWTDRSTPRLDGQEPYLRLQHVTIFVHDQDQSLKFYLDQLGFSLVADHRFGPGERWVAVAPPDGSAILALVTPKPGSEECNLVGQSRQVVFITEDVTAKYNQWRNRGVSFCHPPRTPEWGGTFTSFKDIDGNAFALVGFDQVNQEIEAQRREIAAKLESERRAVQEMEIARQVQARLFPQKLPSISTLDYAGVCVQARQVGGDYYDFIDVGENRLGLVIADVAGKGIAAALLMANLQASLRSQYASTTDQPLRVLKSVNQFFYENTTDSVYATLFFADYCGRSRHLQYVNCGHLPGLLLHEDGAVERLDSTAPVLGLFKDWDGWTGQAALLPGDILTLYTDGITELFKDEREEFGEHHLVESLQKHREQSSSVLIASVMNDVNDFSPHGQFDDVTLIVAKGR